MTAVPPDFASQEELAQATAANLAQGAASSAFELFRDQAFRRVGALDRMPQDEADRIFNELVVAFLVLIMLLLEAPNLNVAPELRAYFTELQKRIPGGYVQQLKTLGVQTEHLRDWEKLIEMRYGEYARDKHDVRVAAMQIESAEKILDLEGLSKIQLLLPVHAVAIGCHHHVCRGETGGKDELFRAILGPLLQFYVELRIRLEGGKNTAPIRVRVAVKRMLRRLKK